MRHNMVKKSLALGIIILFSFASVVPSISGRLGDVIKRNEIENFKSNNQIIDPISSSNETEYWGVCIVAFDDPSSESIEPYIYNSLIESDNWDESHIKLLFKENATKAAILDALDWLIENADSNDIVLFSDNSHGTMGKIGEFGIVPIDGQEEGIITVADLDEKFDAMQAKQICIILDCCLSGNFAYKFSLGIFRKGLEDENRVILMSTMKYGLGFGMTINESGNETHFSFHRFIGEAFSEKIDYNNDDFCSAEEAFRYAKKKWLPYAILTFLMIKWQISIFFSTGFFLIPFPTIYDGVKGDLQICA